MCAGSLLFCSAFLLFLLWKSWDWTVCRERLWLIFLSSTNGTTNFWKYSLLWQLIFLISAIDICLISFVPLSIPAHIIFGVSRQAFAAWCLYYCALFKPLEFNKRIQTSSQVIQTLVRRVALRKSICITSIHLREKAIMLKDADASWKLHRILGVTSQIFLPSSHSSLGFAYPGGVKTHCQFSVFASSLHSLHTQLAWSQVLFSNTLSLFLASREGGEN